VPTDEFKGKSPIGVYGDFVMQVDDSIEQVLQALDDHGVTKNTLVIFTSDNGPVWYKRDRLKHNHSSASIYSGMKGRPLGRWASRSVCCPLAIRD
jgi:arylsulfatase A-like enzyme